METQYFDPQYWLYDLTKNLGPQTRKTIFDHGAQRRDLFAKKSQGSFTYPLTRQEVRGILAYLIHIYTMYYLPERRKSPHWHDTISESKYKEIPKKYRGLYRRLPDGKYCMIKSFYTTSKSIGWYNTPYATVLPKPGTDVTELQKLFLQLHPFTSTFYEHDFEKIHAILTQIIDKTKVLDIPVPQVEYQWFGNLNAIPKNPVYHEFITEQKTKNSKLRALKELKGIRETNEHILELENERHERNKQTITHEFNKRKSKFFEDLRSPFSTKTR